MARKSSLEQAAPIPYPRPHEIDHAACSLPDDVADMLDARRRGPRRRAERLARLESAGGSRVSRYARDVLDDVAQRRARPRDVLHLLPHDAAVRDRAASAAAAARR